MNFLTLHMLSRLNLWFSLGREPCHSGIYSVGQEKGGFEWLATGTLQRGSDIRGYSRGIAVGIFISQESARAGVRRLSVRTR